MACIYFISECVNEHFIGHCNDTLFWKECIVTFQKSVDSGSSLGMMIAHTLNTSGALSKYLQIAEDLAKTCDYMTLTGSGQG